MDALHQQASQAVQAARDAIAGAITERQFAAHPELATRYGPQGRVRCHEDALYHLAYLCEALAVERPQLFVSYISWAQTLLAERNIPAADLSANLDYLSAGLGEQLPPELAALAQGYVEQARASLSEGAAQQRAARDAGEQLSELAEAYLAALLRYDRGGAYELIQAAIGAGKPIVEIYLEVFQRTQHEVGRLWLANRITVAQEHYCTAATQLIMSQLYPHIFGGHKKPYRLLATTVAGDLHELGIRMIADLFELDGWETMYLGANTPQDALLKMLDDYRPHALAISVTMAFHIRAAARLIAAVRAAPGHADLLIMVGGYPFNQVTDLWSQIGADLCASNVREAVELLNERVERAGRGAGDD